MVEGEIIAREHAVCLIGTVEHWNMRLDPALDEPRQIAA